MNARILLKEWKKKQRKAQWHYLVETTPKNLTRFGPESLQKDLKKIWGCLSWNFNKVI
jgi:hypothetical protein